MEYTEHLKLKKPGLNDYINIQDLNDNADLLDEEVSNRILMPSTAAVHYNLNDHKTPGLYYCSTSGSSYSNKPEVTDDRLSAFCLLVEKTGANGNGIVQTISAYKNPDGAPSRWYRTFYGNVWSDWVPIATAIPPQEYDIPLADGWEHTHTWDKNCYLKTQENVVIVNFNAENNNVSVQAGNDYTMGYLPAGFRPNKTVIGVCGDYNYAGNSMYQFWITAAGAIIIHSPDKVPIAASGTAVFVANG